MPIYTQAPSVLGYLNEQHTSTTPEERLDRARGVVFGLAVGNVYGIPLEFWTHRQIAQRYPAELPEPDSAKRNRPMDDDLAQAVDLGEALQDPLPLREFRRRLIECKRNNGRGIANTASEVIAGLTDDPNLSFDVARKVYLERNGGVMHCAPVGVKHWENPESLTNLSARTCALTHHAPLCQWPCTVVNAIIASELRGNSLFLHQLMRYSYLRRRRWNRAVRGGRPDPNGDPGEGAKRQTNASMARLPVRQPRGLIGHTLIALQMGLWAAETALDSGKPLRRSSSRR